MLDFAARGAERPLIAKGNAGIPKYVAGRVHYDGTPDLMAEYAVLARDAGATIVGGCCGATPEHLSRMRAALETRDRGERPTLERVAEALGEFTPAAPAGADAARPARRNRRRPR